jgi:hypothetical protein
MPMGEYHGDENLVDCQGYCRFAEEPDQDYCECRFELAEIEADQGLDLLRYEQHASI